MEQMTVTLDRLIIDKANVRKSRSNDDLADLLASIPVHGVIQPLAVRPPQESDMDLGGQLYRVVGGGRRLLAIEKLITERAIPANYPIPVIVRDFDDTTAAEVSLIENIHRKAMRPVDEFRAFNALVEAGQTVDDIALHFGVTQRLVEGRLALSKLHPDVLAALDEDRITLAMAAAYTICPDPDRQAELLNSGIWQSQRPEDIRRYFMSDNIRSTSPVAELIGEERYLAAGGEVSADLFSNEVWWTSKEIIAELRNQRIEDIKAECIADGWRWALTDLEAGFSAWNCQRLYAEVSPLSKADQKKLDKLQSELEELHEYEGNDEEITAVEADIAVITAKQTKAFTAEQKAMSGVMITDRFEIIYGLLEPGRKASQSASKDEPAPEKDPLTLSASIQSMVGKVANHALVNSIQAHHDNQTAAIRLLVAALIGNNHAYKPIRVRTEVASDMREHFDDKSKFMDMFSSLSDKGLPDLIAMLVDYVALLTDVSDEWLGSQWIHKPEDRMQIRKALLDTFGANPIFHFDPEPFFNGCKKPYLIAAYKEMTGDVLPDGKKSTLVDVVARKASETGWLPPELRFASYKAD